MGVRGMHRDGLEADPDAGNHGVLEMRIPTRVQCYFCWGLGVWFDSARRQVDCPKCSGTGMEAIPITEVIRIRRPQ